MARTPGQIKKRGDKPERWLVSIFVGSEVVNGGRKKMNTGYHPLTLVS